MNIKRASLTLSLLHYVYDKRIYTSGSYQRSDITVCDGRSYTFMKEYNKTIKSSISGTKVSITLPGLQISAYRFRK